MSEPVNQPHRAVEVWVYIDDEGNYAAAKDRETARDEAWDDRAWTGNYHSVRLVATVPLPGDPRSIAAEIAAIELPEGDDD